MPENLAVPVLFAGMGFTAIGLIWLIAKAFAASKVWGLLTLLTTPLGPLLYGLGNWSRCRFPLSMVVFGAILTSAPLAYSRLFPIDLGPRDRVIDGARHITLTGWDQKDYSILRNFKDVTVLELGNPDVTDETLTILAELPLLKELTLNDSGITDMGLNALSNLKNLETLRIARTKITAEGLQHFLEFPPPKVKELDVTGIQVPSSALRKWKNVDPENRKYVN